jgi:Mlc titration factor MtfA (ptsG expression regulator)
MTELRFRIITTLLVAAALALLPALRFGAMAAAIVFAITAAIGLGVAMWPLVRRARVLRAPFPASHRAILLADVDHYRRLGDVERKRFENDVAIFLAEQTITGPKGEPIDEELRVLVAASAAIVVFGRPGFRYPTTRDVIIYEGTFDETYASGAGAGASSGKSYLGMVHGSGPILFSARALRDGFRNPHDASNVGLHEFAHVLDFDAGQADGVPGFMPWKSVSPWLSMMHRETKRIRRHESILRQYAATNEAEFFAVATEMFFEQPDRMKEKHPDLYALMTQAYGQDPAMRSTMLP